MKILVVSLLRLGDALMTAPVLTGLRKAHPGAQIHLLINDQARLAEELLPEVNQVHYLDRQQLQDALVDADRPLLEPFFRLEALVEELRSLQFTRVINLTQNRLSGYLVGALGVEDVTGLLLTADGRASYGSAWFKYLNEQAEKIGGDIFHYVDIFRFGAGLSEEVCEFGLREPMRGLTEKEKILNGTSEYIVIQALTSDRKKDWGVKNWQSFFREFAKLGTSMPAFVLAAPFESEAAGQIVELGKAEGVDVRLATCSLAGAFSLIRSARLLITGDTSIKHLASATACPVIELSIGSSDYKRTGIYRNDCWIVQSKEACAPCSHSAPCRVGTPVCGDRVAPRLIAKIAKSVLAADWPRISRLAAAHFGSVEILRTQMTANGFWQAVVVGRPLDSRLLTSWLDRVTLKLIFQGEHLKMIGDYGTEGLKLRVTIAHEFPTLAPNQLAQVFDHVEAASTQSEDEARDANLRFGRVLREASREQFVDLTEMRLMQRRVDDIRQRLDVRNKLLRTVKLATMEGQ